MPEITFEQYMQEAIDGEIIDKNALIYSRPIDLWSERLHPIIKSGDSEAYRTRVRLILLIRHTRNHIPIRIFILYTFVL